MKLFARSLAALSAATGLAAAASAGTQVSTYAFGYNVANDPTSGFRGDFTDVANPFSLAAFDSTLGSLTSVVVTYGYTAAMSGTSTVTSTGGRPTTTLVAGVDSDPYISFNDYSSLNYSTQQNLVTQTVNNATINTTYNISGTSTITGSTGNFLAQYLAAGATSIDGEFDTATFGYTKVGPPVGAANNSLVSTAAGYVTVTYTYALTAPVPEPASWAMMVGGFGILGGALRRTRAKSAVTFS